MELVKSENRKLVHDFSTADLQNQAYALKVMHDSGESTIDTLAGKGYFGIGLSQFCGDVCQ